MPKKRDVALSLDYNEFNSYYKRLLNTFRFGINTNMSFKSSDNNCGALLSFLKADNLSKLLYNGCPKFVKYLMLQFFTVQFLTSYYENLQPHELWLNLFHPKQRHFIRDSENLGNLSFSESIKKVESEVVACGKTAFVSKSSKLQSEFEYLSRKYFWKKFYKSRDTLNLVPAGALFQKPGSSKVPLYYQALHEAGIVGRLMTEKERKRNKRIKRAVNYSAGNFRNKMTMDGCIVTLFILCAVLAAVGSLVFVCECRKIIWNNVCKLSTTIL